MKSIFCLHLARYSRAHHNNEYLVAKGEDFLILQMGMFGMGEYYSPYIRLLEKK